MVRRLAIASLLCSFACERAVPAPEPARKAPPPRPPADARPLGLEDDLPALAERGVAMYRQVAAILGTSTDCAALAQQLGPLENEYYDALVATMKVMHAGPEKVKQLSAAIEPHQAELDALAKTIAAAPAMKACDRDNAFAAAVDHLLGER